MKAHQLIALLLFATSSPDLLAIRQRLNMFWFLTNVTHKSLKLVKQLQLCKFLWKRLRKHKNGSQNEGSYRRYLLLRRRLHCLSPQSFTPSYDFYLHQILQTQKEEKTLLSLNRAGVAQKIFFLNFGRGPKQIEFSCITDICSYQTFPEINLVVVLTKDYCFMGRINDPLQLTSCITTLSSPKAFAIEGKSRVCAIGDSRGSVTFYEITIQNGLFSLSILAKKTSPRIPGCSTIVSITCHCSETVFIVEYSNGVKQLVELAGKQHVYATMIDTMSKLVVFSGIHPDLLITTDSQNRISFWRIHRIKRMEDELLLTKLSSLEFPFPFSSIVAMSFCSSENIRLAIESSNQVCVAVIDPTLQRLRVLLSTLIEKRIDSTKIFGDIQIIVSGRTILFYRHLEDTMIMICKKEVHEEIASWDYNPASNIFTYFFRTTMASAIASFRRIPGISV